MKGRKVTAIITALILVFGTFTMSFAAEETDTATVSAPLFTDVTDHWGKVAIEKWAGFGIINGNEGLFRPDDPITRGELAVILDNMMDYQVAAKNTFQDLPAGEFYTDAVLKANAAGIIQGYNAAIRPTDKITKEEAVVIFGRAFAVDAATPDKTKFLDAGAVSSWAQDGVFGLEAAGYIQGAGGYFNPQASITRAEVVTIIDNIVKAYYTAAGTYTDNVAGTAVIKVTGVTLKNATVTGNLIIAEGVGQGDVNLDSVTVKGDLVVRGGGENSVHITGNSAITTVTVEKIGDTIRIVVSEGSTVSVLEVAAGEEIIVSGSVGTLQVDAPDVTVSAQGANIKNVNVSGANTTLNVDSKSTVNTINAAAKVTVSGTGTVTNVVLNKGADGSSVTTPNTSTSVSTGVSGVTGGGGTAIPAGSTGKNNASGNGATVISGTGGGGNGGPSGPSDSGPTLAPSLVSLTVSPILYGTGATTSPYAISAGVDANATSIRINIGNIEDSRTYKAEVTIKNSNGTERATASASTIGSNVNTLLNNKSLELADLSQALALLNDEASSQGTDLAAIFDKMSVNETYTITVKITPVGFDSKSTTEIIYLKKV